MALSVRSRLAVGSGDERERVDVERPDDGEVAAVERRDRVLLEALGDGDDGGVDETQGEVVVLREEQCDPRVMSHLWIEFAPTVRLGG